MELFMNAIYFLLLELKWSPWKLLNIVLILMKTMLYLDKIIEQFSVKHYCFATNSEKLLILHVNTRYSLISGTTVLISPSILKRLKQKIVLPIYPLWSENVDTNKKVS